MTTWNPGDGGPDVLSSGDEGPRWASRVRTTALVVVCLLVGGLVGVRLGGWVLDRHTENVTLHAGQVQDLGSCRHRCLRLPLFNDGTDPVRVTGVGFAGWRVVADARAAVVPPGAWGSVRFALPVDCAAPEPASYRTVSVRATVAGVHGERTLRMPGATPLVRRDHDLACPVGRPATRTDLRGVWMLESAYGAWHSLVGRLLMRFGADGSFAWDSTGHLLDPAQATAGRYRLDGRRLTVLLHTMNACHTGDVLTWRLTLTAPDRLHLRQRPDPRSSCSGLAGEVWVARRVLR